MLSHICLNGDPGSGKSVVAKAIVQLTNRIYVSTGELQRRLAAAKGLTTLELNLAAEKDPTIDAELDQRFEALIGDEPAVIDSRMAWLRLPTAFKVRLLCDPTVAGQRVSADHARHAEEYSTAAAASQALAERRDSEVRRYKDHYGVDMSDPRNYDLVVMTERLSVTEIADRIVQFADKSPRSEKAILVADPLRIVPRSDNDGEPEVVFEQTQFVCVAGGKRLNLARASGASVFIASMSR